MHSLKKLMRFLNNLSIYKLYLFFNIYYMVYTFDDYKKEVFAKNPKIKELYENEWLKYAIAERIKKAREQKWMSQLELAKLANTTQSVIARIERWNQNFSITTLSKFLRILWLELQLKEITSK